MNRDYKLKQDMMDDWLVTHPEALEAAGLPPVDYPMLGKMRRDIGEKLKPGYDPAAAQYAEAAYSELRAVYIDVAGEPTPDFAADYARFDRAATFAEAVIFALSVSVLAGGLLWLGWKLIHA